MNIYEYIRFQIFLLVASLSDSIDIDTSKKFKSLY